MDRRDRIYASIRIGNLALAFLAFSSSAAQAADAHTGVKAKPGEIVLLRQVDARPATRMAPPGLALLVNPSPKREIGDALGTQGDGMVELGDTDFATLTSSMTEDLLTSPGQASDKQRNALGKLTGTLGASAGSGGSFSGGQLTSAIGSSMHAVGGAARGAGEQVKSSLVQMPLFDGGKP